MALAYSLCPLWDLVSDFGKWSQIKGIILNKMAEWPDGFDGNLQNNERVSWEDLVTEWIERIMISTHTETLNESHWKRVLCLYVTVATSNVIFSNIYDNYDDNKPLQHLDRYGRQKVGMSHPSNCATKSH